MARGGSYTVTLTFEDVSRVDVERMILDIRNNGDNPAIAADLEVDEEYEDEKF